MTEKHSSKFIWKLCWSFATRELISAEIVQARQLPVIRKTRVRSWKPSYFGKSVSLLVLLSGVVCLGQTLYTNEVETPLSSFTVAWDSTPTNYSSGYTEVFLGSDYNNLKDTQIVSNVPFPYTTCQLPISMLAPGTNHLFASFHVIDSNGNVQQSLQAEANCSTPAIYLYVLTSTDLRQWVKELVSVVPPIEQQRFWKGCSVSRCDWNPQPYSVSYEVTTNPPPPAPPLPPFP